MILPIYAYGQPVLKKVAAPIDPNYEGLEQLIADMWETMYQADGVGLAAPQIGLSIRLFVIDTKQIEKDEKKGEQEPGFKKAFINAEMIDETGENWTYEEGCLSIPRIRGDVERPPRIRLRYLDENFQQHEDDHIQGVLFTERLKPIKKRLIQRKLEDIRQGKITMEYKLRFYNAR